MGLKVGVTVAVEEMEGGIEVEGVMEGGIEVEGVMEGGEVIEGVREIEEEKLLEAGGVFLFPPPEAGVAVAVAVAGERLADAGTGEGDVGTGERLADAGIGDFIGVLGAAIAHTMSNEKITNIKIPPYFTLILLKNN